LTLGIEKLSAQIIEALANVLNPKGILLRNDSPAREREGLQQKVELAYGEIPDKVVIDEYGLKFQVDLKSGQKTGFFFDQRENCQMVRNIARDKRVLDCFCYSGGFALNACQGGATSVLAVDESESALQLARTNSELNGFGGKVTVLQADCFEKLRDLHNRGEKFDLIILDPPAFVKSKEKLGEALKGYKEINLSAMKLLTPEGILVTCSCSYQLSEQDFLKMLRSAARDSKRSFKLLKFTSQAPDHPVLLSMPETKYLKSAFLQALD
jgi:23S rRNA (cytosine1962-C5)-methyltransferase